MENKNNEISNFSKVSSIVSANKELNENKQYIKLLEGQIEKLKKSKITVQETSNKTEKLVQDKTEILVQNKTEIQVQYKTSKSEKLVQEIIKENDFDIDQFEEINGYDLVQYKKKYYLRDLETNEIYNIYNNKPKTIVGLMSNNRIKLH